MTNETYEASSQLHDELAGLSSRIGHYANTRRQEMKWGCFVKSGPFLNAGCIMYSMSIFLFYILLIWEGVRRHPTHPPCLRALRQRLAAVAQRSRINVRSQHIGLPVLRTNRALTVLVRCSQSTRSMVVMRRA